MSPVHTRVGEGSEDIALREIFRAFSHGEKVREARMRGRGDEVRYFRQLPHGSRPRLLASLLFLICTS